MTTFLTQDTDVFAAADAGITFDKADETWTISTGVLVSSGQRDGVHGGVLAFNSLFNNGAIVSAADGRAGVAMNGDHSLVSNAAGAQIIGAFDGLVVDGDTATVNNLGSILGLAHIGVDLGDESNHATLNNGGAIFGRSVGVRDFSLAGGATIHNAGLINSDGIGIDVQTDQGLTTAIGNAAGATIRGGETAIVAEAGGAIFLTNLGRVVGNIETDFHAAVKDVVVNHGKIIGNVFLGAGGDMYNGAGGTVGIVSGEAGNDRLIGGGAAETFFGGLGNDRLVGAGRSDRLDGNEGLDTLIGGPGSDRFVFDTDLNPASNVDRIGDFTAHVDKIVLDRSIFDGVGPVGVLAAAKFHVGAAAADASDHIIYNPSSGFLFYDADGKGGTGQIHFATVAAHLDLHNTDFLVADLLVA